MLTFAQMEKFNAVVSLIDQYEAMIGRIDNGIAAHRIDGAPSSKSQDPHRMEEQLIRKERAAQKLKQLQNLRDENLPVVRKTIQEATAMCKPSMRLKRQLLLMMRYEQGRSWTEIEEITKIKQPKTTVMALLEDHHETTKSNS